MASATKKTAGKKKARKKSKAPKRSSADIYQDVTDRIIAAIETGCAPWQRPWERHGPCAMPRNGHGRPYSGINVMLLWAAAQQAGYRDPRWLTFNQAKKKGGQVRRGERSTQVILWRQITVKDDDEATDDDAQSRTIWVIKTFNVFNAEQVEGLGDFVPPVAVPGRVDALIAASGADLRHGGGRAFYNTTADFIRMPNRDAFQSEAHYHATALHELVHWTGAPHRLEREFGERFGDNAYAVEELIAEMGAAFLCAQLGVTAEGEHQHHAEYLNAWLTVLRADSRAIVTAASAARKAAEFVLQFNDEAAQAA